MDVDVNLSVCNQCGLPLYDAVMASSTKYSCCSADINDFDFWCLNTSPGMVCLSNEKPVLYFERGKKFFDPGGCIAENHSPTRSQTSLKYGEHREEPCGIQFSTQENFVNERDKSESEGAVAANGNAPFNKEKPKDVSSKEEREVQVDEVLQAPSTNRKVSNEERQYLEDVSGSQSPRVSDKERSPSYTEVNTINEFQYLSLGKDPLKPGEVSILKTFYRFLTQSGSATDGNKMKEIASPRAAGTSTGSVIHSKCIHSASKLSCCETLSREIENLKGRVSQNEDFRRQVVEEVRGQRKLVQSHQENIPLLRTEMKTILHDLADLRNEHNQLKDEIERLLAQEDPLRIRHDLINLMRSMEVVIQGKVQRLENRSQSLETMLNRLIGEIEKLFVPYGPTVVQSTP